MNREEVNETNVPKAPETREIVPEGQTLTQSPETVSSEYVTVPTLAHDVAAPLLEQVATPVPLQAAQVPTVTHRN